MNSLFILPRCTCLFTFNSISSLKNFEVRVRVRSVTGQKARVRAKCVRAKVGRCEVCACGQKSVTPNTLLNLLQKLYFLWVIKESGLYSWAGRDGAGTVINWIQPLVNSSDLTFFITDLGNQGGHSNFCHHVLLSGKRHGSMRRYQGLGRHTKSTLDKNCRHEQVICPKYWIQNVYK